MDRDRQRHRVLRVVAEIGVHQPQEPLPRRAGDRQHQQRQRHLHRHHDAVRALPLDAAHDAPRARLGRRARGPDARAAAAGHTPKISAVTIASAVLKSRTGTFISITDSAANEFVGSQATISARPFQAISIPSAVPARAIASGFGQQLPHDAEPAGAQRGADGELLLAMRAAHEQQDRHVGAADEQQRRHRRQAAATASARVGRAYSSTMLRRFTWNVSG